MKIEKSLFCVSIFFCQHKLPFCQCKLRKAEVKKSEMQGSHFLPQLFTTKMVKLFFPIVVRQPCLKSFMTFILNQQDVIWTRLVVREWQHHKCCIDVLWMSETIFFDQWVKHHLWRLLLPHWHWSKNHFQCIILRTGSLELIYIKWL